MGAPKNLRSNAIFAIKDIDEDTPIFTRGRVVGLQKYGAKQQMLYKVIFDNYPDAVVLVDIKDVAYMADLDRPFAQVVEQGYWGRSPKRDTFSTHV